MLAIELQRTGGMILLLAEAKTDVGCDMSGHTRNTNDWAVAEVRREEIFVQCGRHEDDTEIYSLWQPIPQQDQQKICKLISLVYFVHDDVRHSCRKTPAE